MYAKAQAILNWIAANPNHTELEIARGVGLKKTPYTRQILMWLWQEQSIIRWFDTDRHPAAFCYYVQQTEELPL